MTRKYIDCREFPSEMNCTVAIAADSETELLEVAAQHAVAVHHHQDDAQLRRQLRQLIKDGTPAEHVTVTASSMPGARTEGVRPH